MKRNVAKLGNHLFKWSPGLYRPLYSAYKMVSDRTERRLITGIVHSGMTVIDVGANIGVYTNYFAKIVGPSGRVIALEPERENFKRLSESSRSYPWIELHQVAASDTSGSSILYKSGSLNVDHHTYDAGEFREQETIACITLDDLIPAGTIVDFIKMDIQGAEVPAVIGASRVLAENRIISILFEYWPYGIRRSGHTPQSLLDSLRGMGFSLQTVDSNPIPTVEGVDDYINIIATRS